MMEIEDRHLNVAALNHIIGSQPFLLDSQVVSSGQNRHKQTIKQYINKKHIGTSWDIIVLHTTEVKMKN